MDPKNGFTHRTNIYLIIGLILVVGVATALILLAVTKRGDDPLGPAGSGVSVNNAQPQPLPQKVDDAPVTLDGNWTAELNGARFDATITSGVITINMTNNGTTMLYWCGSFDGQKIPGHVITSSKIEQDKAVLSTAQTKIFQVRAYTLAFEFKMLGQTHNVELAPN